MTFARIVADLGPVEVLIWNADKGVWGTAEDVGLDAFAAAWRTNTLGSCAATKAVVTLQRHGAHVLLEHLTIRVGVAGFALF